MDGRRRKGKLMCRRAVLRRLRWLPPSVSMLVSARFRMSWFKGVANGVGVSTGVCMDQEYGLGWIGMELIGREYDACLARWLYIANWL